MFNPQAYRTNLGWRNYLGVSVLAHGSSTPVDGVVREVNADGLAVTFPGDDNVPDLRAGDAVTVRLTASWLPRALVTGATLCGRQREGESIIFEFDFASPGSVDEQITPVLHSIFNRRVAPRVIPAEGDDSRVAIHPHDGKPAKSMMHQISSTGISVFMNPDEAKIQEIGGSVWISFFLAGRTEPIQILGALRNRRMEGKRIVLGYEFDKETPGFARIQGALFGYILTRTPVRDPIFESEGETTGKGTGSGSHRRRLA